jgi:hypothetical protein
MNLVKSDYRQQLVDIIRKIDTNDISDDVEVIATSKVVDEQKVYIWIRLHLNQENNNILPGDDVEIKWAPSGETLVTKFVCFGKSGLERDHLGQVTNYNPDDDRRILCLMVDENEINFSNDIPFIRTLFKTGRHYDYQLVKRSELLFINKKNQQVLDYFDCDF